ncbi:peroxisome biogenesis protein 16 isoform X2 [Dioscorea cayenensis subsp. rotundata]|uniref:Peroxisomal membrane protein PEX16 n=1 Tax=Dioscorea cayennensis subsp. rotundata TaxID=55577 RepID=A0AB40CD05_DIOCR|nr:peroxisome biogenesis protein 16 isoform X2 [Dioscorea cayenensis subsp. rotundata]
MEVYKAWVRRNQEFIHSLESLANGITWLLPERFSNSEIGPEAVYALLGIAGDVNQYIIDTAPSRTSSMGSESSSSFPWTLCVSALKNLETVVEVAAQHFFGDDGKWNFIAATEATKVLVRLGMLRDSGWKMLLEGGGTVNSEKSKDLWVTQGGIRRDGRPVENFYGDIPPHLERRAMAALSRFGENAKISSDPMWRQRLRQSYEPPAEVVEKPTFSSIWFEKGLSSQLLLTGEVLSIMRPLLYVLLIRKYGIRSWFPWAVSLGVDLTGISFLSFATNPKRRSKELCYHLSSSEKEEIKRRKRILALYLMRDPFFTKYTKNILEKGDRCFSQIPVAGFLIAKGVELLIGAQTRFTYTLGS